MYVFAQPALFICRHHLASPAQHSPWHCQSPLPLRLRSLCSQAQPPQKTGRRSAEAGSLLAGGQAPTGLQAAAATYGR